MTAFFRVTCPFLFILDTVAFFPIIRGKKSSMEHFSDSWDRFFNKARLKGENGIDIIDQFEARESLRNIVHVYDVSACEYKVYNDVPNEHLLITCK